LVEFVGEIGDREKQEFLGNAYALLFPIDWVEPFGLVLIEAMACGTPTIAFRQGSVPEIIDDGVTGFTVDSVGQALHALEKIPRLDRARCREVFEQRFSSRRMAADYIRAFERLVEAKRSLRPASFRHKETTRTPTAANARVARPDGLVSYHSEAELHKDSGPRLR